MSVSNISCSREGNMYWLTCSTYFDTQVCIYHIVNVILQVWNHPNLLILAKEEKDMLSEDSMDDILSEDGFSSEDESNGLKKLGKVVFGYRDCRQNNVGTTHAMHICK